jgi:hypothetical protein
LCGTFREHDPLFDTVPACALAVCRFSFFAGMVTTSDVAFSEDYKAYLYLFTSIDWISRQDDINV